jgi:hypothetical protein
MEKSSQWLKGGYDDANLIADIIPSDLFWIFAKMGGSTMIPPVVNVAPSVEEPTPEVRACGAAPTRVRFEGRSAAPLTIAEECMLKPKNEFKECSSCPVMVVVPPGEFFYGLSDH